MRKKLDKITDEGRSLESFLNKLRKKGSDECYHLVKFWGVRGSIPVPQAEMLGFGGDTSCVQISTTTGKLIIIDMGTGIRPLGVELLQSRNSPIEGYILLSHTHWDHIQGFPFFQPAFIRGNHFSIFGPRQSGEHLSQILAGQMENKYFPISLDQLNAEIKIKQLDEGRFQLDEEIIVETASLSHPNGVYGYRLEIGKAIVVYATDCEHPLKGVDDKVVELARGANLLIHDSHFTTEELPSHIGWGHSSWEKGVEVARLAGVQQLVLFHYNPNYTDETIYDIELKARKRFQNTIAARQGMELRIPDKRT